MSDEIDPQAATSGTVADVKEAVAQAQTPEELEALRQAEADGKDRTTAHAAIDAKEAELSSGDPAPATDGDENVTKPPVVEGADPIDQPATTLVQAPHPEDLTDAQINEATGDGLKDGASQQQADAANTLAEARDEAQGEDVDHSAHPLYGYGPGADIG